MAVPHHLPSDLRDLLRAEALDPEHPPAVEAEARAVAASPGVDDPELVDLTAAPFVTVDTTGARDLDQALLIEAHPEGWRVRYAIADASWFVRPGTALFAEALRRGSSLYVPGLVIPMLPRTLSEDIASLKPHADRRALVFDTVVGRDGQAIETTVVRARVRSRAKLSFADVQAFYDSGRPPLRNPEIVGSLERLREVGEARIALAERHHVIRTARREVSVRTRGSLLVFSPVREQNAADRYNEEVSVLCNTEGARLLAANPRARPVYRVDGPAATYGTEPGDPPYARLSAPLRELVGVYLHLAITTRLADERLRDEVLAAAQRADELQRRLDANTYRLALEALLRRDARATRARTGVVAEIGADGIIVRLEQPPVRLPVDRRSLEIRYGALEPDPTSLRRADGSVVVRPGDEVVVQAMEPERDGRWDIRLTVRS